MVTHHVVTKVGLRNRLYSQLEPDARDKSGLSGLNMFIIALVLISFLALALETGVFRGRDHKGGFRSSCNDKGAGKEKQKCMIAPPGWQYSDCELSMKTTNFQLGCIHASYK